MKPIASALLSTGLAAMIVVLTGAAQPSNASRASASDTVAPDSAQPRNRSGAQDPEGRRVVSAIEALFAAAERNDLAALDSLYAGEDLTIIESTGINRGWTDYRDHHLAPEMKEMKDFRYRPYEIEPHVSGNLAWAIFRYNLKAEIAGRALDLVGRGTAVLEKRSGKWVVRHTHTASRARRPTDPPAGF